MLIVPPEASDTLLEVHIMWVYQSESRECLTIIQGTWDSTITENEQNSRNLELETEFLISN